MESIIIFSLDERLHSSKEFNLDSRLRDITSLRPQFSRSNMRRFLRLVGSVAKSIPILCDKSSSSRAGKRLKLEKLVLYWHSKTSLLRLARLLGIVIKLSAVVLKRLSSSKAGK